MGSPRVVSAQELTIWQIRLKILKLDFQLPVLYLGFKFVKPARRWARDAASVSAELSTVTGTYKLILVRVPRHGTSEVRTDWREDLKVTLCRPAYKDSLMRYNFSPSIALSERNSPGYRF